LGLLKVLVILFVVLDVMIWSS